MATNKAYEQAWNLRIAVPSTVKSGDPLLVGKLPGVAETDYSSTDGCATVCFHGAYTLSVLGSTAASPVSGSALKTGDPVYAEGGTTDSTTNVTTGFTLDKATGGVLFGNVLGAVGSAATVSVAVKLGGKAA
jgi:predicted RecA/RadA family phage recombinase